MIAQISAGESFGGLVNYANDILKKDAVIVASDGVSLTSNATITASFKAQAKARPSLRKFVGHISLSFSPDDKDKLDDQKIAEIAREYMRRMGIVNTQYVVFRHHDQPHPHVHIVYNRVDNDGNSIKGDGNFTKSAAITKALTREYGLTFGKGKDKVRRERLKGKDATKYRLYDEITAALKDCITWQDFQKVLSAKGISFNLVKNTDGSVRGMTFTDTWNNITFAGSKIDRSLSYAKIDGQLANIIVYDARQDDEPIRLQPENTKPFDVEEAFDFSQISSGTQAMSNDSDAEQQTTGTDGGTSTGSGIGENIVEVLLQPSVAPSSGGGGSPSNGWRDDDDDEKDKKRNKTRRKGR